MVGVAQVPGAIELMQAREGKAGGVADVVQPRGGLQKIGVRAEDGCQAACPSGNALDVCPVMDGPGEVSWTPCICAPAREAAGRGRAWDTSGSPVTAAMISSGRRCSTSRRTTAGTGRSPDG